MSRIAIFGNTAGGKSTLARHLSERYDLPYVEIDALLWQADWSMTPPHIYKHRHDAEIAKDKWIIDGVGDLASTKARAKRATELILLDFPIWIHFWRAAERQMAWANGTIEHPPGGAEQQMPSTGRLFEMMWEMDRDWMPILRDLCDEHEEQGKKVRRLTALDELEHLLKPG